MKYKIAFGGIHIESSTFTDYISKESDFYILRDQNVLDRYEWLEKYSDRLEPIGLVHARALPGGVVDRKFFDKWLEEFLFRLDQAYRDGLDGLLFDIHGAMSVENLDDAEGYIGKKIREKFGQDLYISTSMDLHGNVSDDLFEISDLITCYRTAPHIDVVETRERALRNLLEVLENNKTIYKMKADIPMLLSGEQTSTQVEPGKSIYKMIDEIEKIDCIIEPALWMGFPWADEARCHTVVTMTGYDKDLVESELKKYAEHIFSKIEDFDFVGPTADLDSAIDQALKSDKKPFFISDTGDNPGAGGSGDLIIVLEEFLKRAKEGKIEKTVVIASIFDSQAIHTIYKSNEKIVDIKLGAKIDSNFGKPLDITCKVLRKFTDPMGGKSALVEVDGIHVIITENRIQYATFEKFEIAGLESFDDYEIFVVKIGYLEPDLAKAAKGWVMALTDGPVNQDLSNMNFKKLKRPLYPLDKVALDQVRYKAGQRN